MKLSARIQLFALICLFAGFSTPAARANLINITNNLGSPASLVSDFNKGTVGNMGNQTVANWLTNQVNSYNTFLNSGPDLAAPVGLGVESSGSAPVDLTGFSYAVLHYGKGPGGTGQGGGVVAYYLNGMTGNFSFPSKGLGSNGKGGLSFVRLYGPTATVPEAGSTIALLSLALIGLGIGRRKLGVR